MDERTDQDYASAIGNAAFVLRLRERGVRDTAVLRAMEQVPREAFAPASCREHARRDIALPLPCGQTMTAPTTIAAMLIALGIGPDAGPLREPQVPSPARERGSVAPTDPHPATKPMRVLEIGTGSGYVTALLLRLGATHVRSLERYEALARAAGDRLAGDFSDATVAVADGLGQGAAEPEAFQRILVNGCLREVPRHLSAALAPGGRLVGVLATGEGPCLVAVERGADGALAQRIGNHVHVCPLTPGPTRVL